MKWVVVENYEKMSQAAAEEVARVVSEKPSAVLGLATGGTPIGMYEVLVQMHKQGEIDFSQVKSFNLDEYVGLTPDHSQSYHTYMHTHLFASINIPLEHIHIPSGDADDLMQECEQYEALIQSVGGIDLQVLGIGENGHIGFNEPGSSPEGKTSVVQLADSTIQSNSRYFERIEDVPRQAITVGLGTILTHSRRILLLANGKSKAQAIKRILDQEPNVDNPASYLKLHKDVTIIVDEQAAQLIENRP